MTFWNSSFLSVQDKSRLFASAYDHNLTYKSGQPYIAFWWKLCNDPKLAFMRMQLECALAIYAVDSRIRRTV